MARSLLPAPLDRFVGREAELAQVDSLLERYRLVTVLGPGGAGKTRLAVELATRVQGRYPDGVWLVELDSLTDPALLPQTVADALLVREEIGRSVLDVLTDALGPGRGLLVLDSCEQVVAPAARLAAELLRRCRNLQVLVTSREALDLPGEAVFRVRELSLPPNGARTDPDRLLDFDAVRLFVERARAGNPDFALTGDNAGHVAAICTRLDGLPLAIELAARRTRLFGVAEINARLDDRFRLLTAGPRTAAGRHRDLRTTIEWSYDLLDEVEQIVLRRLSVLVGGFAIATATAVCAGERVPAGDMLDLLSGLEARSLITAGGDGGRFRQLESIRLYGRERLAAAGEEDVVFDRLARYLLDLADPVIGDSLLHCYEELEPLDVERANLVAVIEWAARRRDPRRLPLAAALGRCWRHHGYLSDGRALLRAAIDAAGPDHPGYAAAFVQAAGLAAAAGDFAAATSLAAEAVRIEEHAGHPVRLFRAMDMVARVHTSAGEPEQAHEVGQRALAMIQPVNRPLDTAVAMHNAAYHALQAGHRELAGELMEACLPLYREHSPYPLPPEWLHSAGMLALARDATEAADGHFREALERYLTLADTDDLPVIGVTMLDSLALTAALRDEPVRALRLAAAAEAMRRARHARREADVQVHVATALDLARGRLAPDRARAAEGAGARLNAIQAVRYAVRDAWAAEDSGEVALTGRESQIARLVAAGLTNRQIASRLHMAERSVEASLRAIRARLGLRSRAQLAAWSIENLGEAAPGRGR
jgi:predicted ATPase/DNA-binding NarL/FixJ family response regulator